MRKRRCHRSVWTLLINHSVLLAAGFRRFNFDFRSAVVRRPRRWYFTLEAVAAGAGRSMLRRCRCRRLVQMTTTGSFVRSANVNVPRRSVRSSGGKKRERRRQERIAVKSAPTNREPTHIHMYTHAHTHTHIFIHKMCSLLPSGKVEQN